MADTNTDNQSEKEIKIILLGEAGVGKTNLIRVFFGLDFQDISESNVSSFSFQGNFNYGNKSYTYNVWDTAGQERFRSINKIMLKGTNIILIVYAINNKRSFEELHFWINFVKENKRNEDYILAIVGNKIDLFEDQMVMEDEAQNLADKYGIELLITSAKDTPETFKAFLNRLISNYIEKYIVKSNKDRESSKDIIHIKKGSKGEKAKRKKCC